MNRDTLTTDPVIKGSIRETRSGYDFSLFDVRGKKLGTSRGHSSYRSAYQEMLRTAHTLADRQRVSA